jgi:hypothetical protein
MQTSDSCNNLVSIRGADRPPGNQPCDQVSDAVPGRPLSALWSLAVHRAFWFILGYFIAYQTKSQQEIWEDARTVRPVGCLIETADRDGSSAIRQLEASQSPWRSFPEAR